MVIRYEDLTEYEVNIIKEFCKRHEDEFRGFVEGFIRTKSEGAVVNAEEMAYEFCKPLIREKKINELLD